MTSAQTSLSLYLDRLTTALSTATAVTDPEAGWVDRGIIGGA